MLCFMTLIKYEASIKLLTTTPVYELLQSALTIGTCQKKITSTKTGTLSIVSDKMTFTLYSHLFEQTTPVLRMY